MSVVVEHDHCPVRITQGRWDVRIELFKKDGKVEYVASADSALTGGSGLWFGTVDEWVEEVDRYR